MPFWQQVPGKRLAYVKCVTAVLLKHAHEGNLISHGYAGHLLLSGLSHVLRVRVIADMEYRIRSAMQQARLNRAGAIAHIRRVDEQRRRWVRLLYGVDWEDPAQYTVVLNLAQVTVASACETIAQMAALDEFQPNPRHVDLYRRLYERVYSKMYERLLPLFAEIQKITGYPE